MYNQIHTAKQGQLAKQPKHLRPALASPPQPPRRPKNAFFSEFLYQPLRKERNWWSQFILKFSFKEGP